MRCSIEPSLIYKSNCLLGKCSYNPRADGTTTFESDAVVPKLSLGTFRYGSIQF